MARITLFYLGQAILTRKYFSNTSLVIKSYCSRGHYVASEQRICHLSISYVSNNKRSKVANSLFNWLHNDRGNSNKNGLNFLRY